MRTKAKYLTAVAISLFLLRGTALAGFEWTPEEAQTVAPQALPSAAPASDDRAVPLPAAPVTAQPLAPPPGAAVPGVKPERPVRTSAAPAPMERRASPAPGAAMSGKTGGLVINPYPDRDRQKETGGEPPLLEAVLKESGHLKPMPSPLSRMPISPIAPPPSMPTMEAQTPLAPAPAPVPVVQKPDYAEIQGFGRDMPLAIALSQVVPARFTYSFAPDVNPGVPVSWQGGRGWDSVLQDMLFPVDMSAEIRPNSVYVRKGAVAPPPVPPASMPMPAVEVPVSTPMVAAAARPGQEESKNISPPVSLEKTDRSPVSTTKSLEDDSDTGPQKAVMISRATDIVADEMGMEPQKRPLVPARFSYDGQKKEKPRPEEIAEKPMRQTANVEKMSALPLPPSEESLNPVPVKEGVREVEPLNAVAEAERAPESIIPIGVEKDRAMQDAPMSGDAVFESSLKKSAPPREEEVAEINAAPAKTFEVSRAKPEMSAPWRRPSSQDLQPVMAHNYGLDRVRTWRAIRGDSLRTVLEDWSEDAGVEMHWASQYDYPLDSSVRVKGTYEEAVKNILTGLRDATPRPVARLHPNEPDGPAVLVVEVQQIIQ